MTAKPTVTIGVPVHNGATHLKDCLECLRTQTFTDFKVVIFENHSTDSSLEIAQEFVDKDTRFTLLPAEQFLDMGGNFKRTIAHCAAESEYFLLRAHDDTAHPDYLQLLVDTLNDNPEKDLVVGNVTHVIGEGDERTVVRVQEVKEQIFTSGYYTTPRRIFSELKLSGSWYYGLFRGKKSGDILLDTLEHFPSVWAADKLALMRFFTQDKAIFCPEAMFICTLGSASDELYSEKTVLGKIRIRKFYHQVLYGCKYSQRPKSVLHNIAFSILCFRAARKHTHCKTRDIIKQFFRELVQR